MFFALSKSRLSAKIQIIVVTKTSEHIQTKIKMQNPIQETLESFKVPNEALEDIDVLSTFKIKIENQNLDHCCIKDQ